ncbi:hypothetical protein PPYR_10888 [Photinus pyralis]|uniref:C2H2-type domain-containing protein n=1 Tax=Photinus pyralis TaxID=7054 RepID=A0A1Y1K1B1_PHOPY|nr:zinc finger protein 431-like isoform X2 [Photinus pyralis]KAB0796827.1 hypothetical protein PPYR_10888 [Photinus pyralis]
MDNTEEPYLTLLNDGTNNYLLQTSDETLVPDPSLNVEPMFTEIEDGAGAWSVGLPILMNGGLISEDQELVPSIHLPEQNNETVPSISPSLPDLYQEPIESHPILQEEKNENVLNYPIELPSKGFITSDGLFISNDLLYQLKLNVDNDPNTNTEPVTKNNNENGNAKNGDHLLNNDGPVVNVEQLLGAKGIANNEGMYFDVVMAHKCKQCAYLCEEKTAMLIHWQTNHLVTSDVDVKSNGEMNLKSILKPPSGTETVYICSECSMGFGSTEKLKIHMMNVHKLIQHVNEEANGNEVKVKDEKSAPNNVSANKKMKISLAEIEKQAKASKKLKCSVKGCDLRFSLEDMRSRHEKCHVEGEKKQFKCFECGKKFSIWRICSLHLWKCHKVDLGLFTCPMCVVFKASSAGRLLTHMAIHDVEKPFLCNVCGKSFKLHTELRNHHFVLHKDVESVPEWAVQQQCDTCKKFFANPKSLKKHIQSVHDQYKPFICNICGHKTARKAMLDLHLRQHTGEKPHQCPVCDYRTGDHNSLRRHLMRHSGDTKYACPHCNYQSIQSTSYKNHIASKHPGLGGSYFCSICSYHTVNENTYNNHLTCHKEGLINENGDSADASKKISKDPKPASSPSRKKQKGSQEQEDDETQNYLLMLDHSNDAIGVDTGGITIPAGLELVML